MGEIGDLEEFDLHATRKRADSPKKKKPARMKFIPKWRLQLYQHKSKQLKRGKR